MVDARWIEWKGEVFLLYDYNKNLLFEYQEIHDILLKVFELNEEEVRYFLMNYFNFEARKQEALTFEELIAIILSIYFIEIVFRRRYHSSNSEVWKSSRISKAEFVALVSEACFFISVKPLREDLEWIFDQLDDDKDGFISFKQYCDFIKKYLGNNIELAIKKEQPANPQGVSQKELDFVQLIWDELHAYFVKYDTDKNNWLAEEEFKAFVKDVLAETSAADINYIFWNLFRIDVDSNKKIEFEEFAPFVLNHAGEIALQRFHREQEKGKKALSCDEMYVVLNNAYRFLVSMPKNRPAVESIHARISKNGAVDYASYLNWIHKALAAKYKK